MARILIVDDNLMIRTLLREILSDAGHEVVGDVDNGLEAPSRVHELRPELVTLDLVMPGRGGLETLQHLLMIDPGLTVIVCSASLDQRRVISALRLGAKGFILKPFHRSDVLDSVRAALGHTNGRAPTTGAVLANEPPSQWVHGAEEKREFVRVRVALPIMVEVAHGGSMAETFTVDLSGGGVLLASASLEVGASVGFHLDLGCSEPPVEGRARVVRVTPDGQTALAFQHMSVADHERLIRYLHDHEVAAVPAP